MNKYKKGDHVIIIKELNGHGFRIGDRVEIVFVDKKDKNIPLRCHSIDNKKKFPEYWLSESEVERTFTKTEVRKIARKAMNMGMELRQNQLQGQGGDKSGDELLKEYLDKL